MNQKEEKPATGPSTTNASPGFTSSKFILAAALLTFCLIAAAAAVYLTKTPINISGTKKPLQNTSQGSEEPVALVPDKPDGVTIVEKMPELEESDQSTALIPVAQGAAAAQGFAVDLGEASSYSALSARFASLVEANDKATLDKLEPRVLLKDTDTGLQARLLIGPLETLAAAQTLCKTLTLPPEIKCDATQFEGELIDRQP